MTFKYPDAISPDNQPTRAPMPPDGMTEKDRPDKPEEACGVFGIYAPGEEVAKLTYFGLFALQHRGQEAAGIATFDEGQIHIYKNSGLVSQVFNEGLLGQLTGTHAIGHTRYSTTGSSRVANAQPFVVGTRLGSVALAHNGNLVNAYELRQEFETSELSPVTTTDSEMIALAIAQEVNAGKDWTEGAISAFKRCEGAFSLTIATPNGVMGVRDPRGIRPLMLGVINEESDLDSDDATGSNTTKKYVFASETCGLDIIGAEFIREVRPGELIWITEKGLTSVQWANAQRKMCVFEMIYFARPDSVVDDESLYSYRMRLGKQLAIESPADVDLIMGVPDSGIPAAIGYSEQSGIPYAEGLIKNRYVGRTFIQPTQSMREAGIRMKLNPLKDVLVGKRILIVDDSIVRGTTSRKIVKALRDAGAIAVHMRISSPPVTHPCFYGIDTDNQDQLIAATHSIKDTEKHIGVESLAYLSLEGMLDSTQHGRDRFCSACFTGHYPVAIPEQIQRSKLLLEKVVPLTPASV